MTYSLTFTCRFDPEAKYVFIGDFSGQISVLRLNYEESSLTVVTTLKGHTGEDLFVYNMMGEDSGYFGF